MKQACCGFSSAQQGQQWCNAKRYAACLTCCGKQTPTTLCLETFGNNCREKGLAGPGEASRQLHGTNTKHTKHTVLISCTCSLTKVEWLHNLTMQKPTALEAAHIKPQRSAYKAAAHAASPKWGGSTIRPCKGVPSLLSLL